jgi:hypothetical protein
VCTFADADRICRIIEAMLKSYDAGCVWQEVDSSFEAGGAVVRREAVHK